MIWKNSHITIGSGAGVKNESDFQVLSQMIYARIIVGGGKLLSDTKKLCLR